LFLPPLSIFSDEYKKRPTEWWNKADNNWNQVCNGGLIVGSLAIAETDPSYAKDMIPKALENLPFSNKFYAPMVLGTRDRAITGL
jgi:hypothetical protein